MSKEENKPSISVIQLALPEFRDLTPEVWFTVFELELENRNIFQDRAKYAQLVPRLPRDLLTLITPILVNPPAEDAYERVKQAILEDSRPSERARLEQLCHTLRLGDRKPTQLLREMQQLAGPGYLHDALLQELWLQRLPDTLQAILAVVPATSLADLAQAADAVLERLPKGAQQPPQPVAGPSHSIHSAVSSTESDKDAQIATLQAALARTRISQPSEPSPEVTALRQEVAQLRRLILQGARRERSRSRRRSFTRDRPRSGTRHDAPSSREGKQCWYHTKHGADARNCEPWCIHHKADRQGN